MALNNNPTPNEVVKGIKTLEQDKMDKTNPTGSGSFSMNRASQTTIGNYSSTLGYNNVATGQSSHAEGQGTIASGWFSHSEGQGTIASGKKSHAEGSYTISAGENQHVFGKYNVKDTEKKYIEIVGNGSESADDSKRSNARTLDWSGNEYLAGNLQASGLTDGTTTKTMSEILAGGGMKLWRYED